ncbi:MAG: hypothetical protein [Circular genetic element sp.]|nr:MAG: hypothetical protein [Circular genetic element sp.]
MPLSHARRRSLCRCTPSVTSLSVERRDVRWLIGYLRSTCCATSRPLPRQGSPLSRVPRTASLTSLASLPTAGVFPSLRLVEPLKLEYSVRR